MQGVKLRCNVSSEFLLSLVTLILLHVSNNKLLLMLELSVAEQNPEDFS